MNERLRATLERKREEKRREEEAAIARWRPTPEELAITSITEADWHQYAVSEDGSIGSVQMRVMRDPACCAFAHFDADDLDKVAPYKLYGRRVGKDRLQPLLSRVLSYCTKDYYSVGRMLLGIDDPQWNVRYLNGNPLDNRRSNLATYKLRSQFPAVRYYGPGWPHIRRLAWARSKGICERCRKVAGVEVHHLIPARFFKHPEDANFLPNLLVVCKDCHRIEHARLHLEMPLFYGVALPEPQKSCSMRLTGASE